MFDRPFIAALAALILAVFTAGCADSASTPADEKAPLDLAAATDGLEAHQGFIDIYADASTARVFAVLPAPGADGMMLRAIHAARLTGGLGSNPIGLDRGWGGSGQIVRFRRIGARVVLEVENHRYRASADNAAERAAVAQSFATSFLWAGPVHAEGADGRVMVDLTGLLTSDVLGLASAMAEDGAGFELDPERSFADVSAALAFPDNVEFDAHLTFASAKPGPEVRATAPYPGAVTLTAHHSFVRLPDDGYRPRRADPRMGVLALETYDFSAPLTGEVRQALAIRHRLQRETSGDPESPVVRPIVFYVDPGAPEDIRSALVDGASWWADAFAAAGFKDAYRVEILPEGAHPLDARFNVIQWVHRQTRGWSYGGGVIDPRTGELIKGHVILGSQRVRQDRMIFEGLAGAQKSGRGGDDDPVQLSLARIRQLAAHEVAHALGFGHNFAASINDRASVADYPAPWVTVTPEGGLDFSRAYAAGVGPWDVATVKWLYGEFDATGEAAALNGIVAETRAAGLLYVADEHGRSAASGHTVGSVWDNGADPVSELENTLAVRRIALAGFGPGSLSDGRPLSALRETIVPIYLYHRYQLDAAAKAIGGMTFQYGVSGLDAPSLAITPRADQARAVAAVLKAIDPAALDLPEPVLAALEPPVDLSFTTPQGPREAFVSRAEPAFDLVAAAETAADLVFAALLAPERAERLVQLNLRDPGALGLEDLLIAVDAAVLRPVEGDARRQALARVVRGRYVAALIALGDSGASELVRAKVRTQLALVATRLDVAEPGGVGEAAHRAYLGALIDRALDRPATPAALAIDGPAAPPGSPIGGASVAETCWHCETR